MSDGCRILEQWIASLPGQEVVRELRWLAPTHATLVQRVRIAVGRPTGAGEWQIRRVCEPCGIPVRGNGETTWGPGYPTWAEAAQLWLVPCSCTAGDNAGEPMVCSVCGGARAGHPCSDDERNLCSWCSGRALISCSACLRGIHFRGECSRWNLGAHHTFTAGPSVDRTLCPDCAWRWVKSLASRGRSAPNGLAVQDLHQHLADLARSCVPGAGLCVAQPRQGTVSLRRLRRWTLRFLRTRGWVRTAALTRQAAQAFHGEASDARLSGIMQHMLRLLVRGGVLSQNGHGVNAAIRAGAPTRFVVHRRRVRRTR